MKNNNYYNLSKIIRYDLVNVYKIQIILLIMLIISSILLITIIHKTRLLITEQTVINKIKINIKKEWNYLILQKHLLLSHNRIENNVINKLGMIHTPIDKENIIFINHEY